MIYIFSSAYYELFKQNVLNASCYPEGHVMRLRYDAEYVDPAARKDPDSIKRVVARRETIGFTRCGGARCLRQVLPRTSLLSM